MQLILSYISAEETPKIDVIIPNEPISEEIKGQICQNIERYAKEQMIAEESTSNDLTILHEVCEVSSDWNPKGLEIIMVSAILDKNEPPKFAKILLKITVSAIQAEYLIFKALYPDSYENDPDVHHQKQKIRNIFAQTINIYVPNLDKLNAIFAEIVFLGIQAVGKSTIAHRLTSGELKQTLRPTLAPQVLKLILNEVNFRIYDMGGQTKIRQSWKTTCPRPNGIIFIIDSTHSSELHQDAINMFNEMMRFYFEDPNGSKLPNTTPVLILANKIDVNPNYSVEMIEQYYEPKKFKLNYKIGLVSALKSENLYQNFEWLVLALQKMKLT